VRPTSSASRSELHNLHDLGEFLDGVPLREYLLGAGITSAQLARLQARLLDG
jgi:hypothetical protein